MIKAVERNARTRAESRHDDDGIGADMLAAARRQNALDRVAELLDEWGSAHAESRAVAILEAITAAGYRLPDVDPAAPYRGPGSTPAARDAARVEYLVARGEDRAAAERYVAGWRAAIDGART